MKIIQDINGQRKLLESNLNENVILEIVCNASTNTELSAVSIEDKSFLYTVSYINVVGWNKTKQKYIKIYAVDPMTGEFLEESNNNIITAIQLKVSFLTEDLKEEAWGYIESFKITSYKDKCLISFNRYDDKERDNKNYNSLSSEILDYSKAIQIEGIENSNIVLNYYE